MARAGPSHASLHRCLAPRGPLLSRRVIFAGPILFGLLGFLFGSIARGGAWLSVLFPVFFGVLDLIAEGADIQSVTVIIISIILAAVGVLLGQLLVRPRWDTEKQRQSG
jgi:hypothetical protein